MQPEQQPMTFEQALGIVADVCANYRGTLREHQTIQQAIAVLREAAAPKKDDGEGEKTNKKDGGRKDGDKAD